MKNNLIQINNLMPANVMRSSSGMSARLFSRCLAMLVVLCSLCAGGSPVQAGNSSSNGKVRGIRLISKGQVLSSITGHTDTATFASGCFWCGEAKFSQLKGVLKVTSGYTGGHVGNPSYAQVCTGMTGHAEAFNVIFDSSVITYDELLEAFFLSHDPTQLNRQGNDVGPQYRSAIFFHNQAQEQKASYYISRLTEQKIYSQAIVTEVTRFTVFYDAEKYHQEYYKKHPEQSYCRYVIQPQLEKFKHIFKEKLKQ